MIELMVTATALNIGKKLRGEPATARATWNAVCLADFGDSGVAFVAQPQIPPRNVNWSAKGAWVHLAKVAFEKVLPAQDAHRTKRSPSTRPLFSVGSTSRSSRQRNEATGMPSSHTPSARTAPR